MQESTHARDVIVSSALTAVRVTAVVFFIDRVTKSVASQLPDFGVHPLSSFVTVIQHKNYGVIANIPIPQLVIISATILVLALVTQALRTSIKQGQRNSIIALGILLGGAFGNLYDRVMHGFVFDWILLFGRSAINLADAAIVIGALAYFIEMRRLDAPTQRADDQHA